MMYISENIPDKLLQTPLLLVIPLFPNESRWNHKVDIQWLLPIQFTGTVLIPWVLKFEVPLFWSTNTHPTPKQISKVEVPTVLPENINLAFQPFLGRKVVFVLFYELTNRLFVPVILVRTRNIFSTPHKLLGVWKI